MAADWVPLKDTVYGLIGGLKILAKIEESYIINDPIITVQPGRPFTDEETTRLELLGWEVDKAMNFASYKKIYQPSGA